MFGRKKAEEKSKHEYDEANQAFIKNAVFGKDSVATETAGNAAQAALSKHQKIVNPKNKSQRPKQQ
jgi:hypothetical protein